ncbi:MAG: hypothetical protein ACXW32_13125 [Limisphaerales bacterium]
MASILRWASVRLESFGGVEMLAGGHVCGVRGRGGRGELEFGEVDLGAMGELLFVGGSSIGGDLQSCLFAEVGEFDSLGVAELEGELFFLLAVFVGEDAVEVLLLRFTTCLLRQRSS